MQDILSTVMLAAWSWGDKSDIQIPMALFYALLGILVVFAVLFVLILLFTLLEKIFKYNLIDRATAAVKRFFGKLFKKKKVAPVDAQQAVVTSAEEEDEEVIAAITAAIAVLMQDDGGAPAPFKIRSVKRNHCH